MWRSRNFSNSANFSVNESDANRVLMTRLLSKTLCIHSFSRSFVLEKPIAELLPFFKELVPLEDLIKPVGFEHTSLNKLQNSREIFVTACPERPSYQVIAAVPAKR